MWAVGWDRIAPVLSEMPVAAQGYSEVVFFSNQVRFLRTTAKTQARLDATSKGQFAPMRHVLSRVDRRSAQGKMKRPYFEILKIREAKTPLEAANGT